MAKERNMIGFELGTIDEFSIFAAGCSLVNDPAGITPRTGLWFLRMAPTAQQSTVNIVSDGTVLNGSYAGSGHLRIHVRMFIRINTYPSSSLQFADFGTICNLFIGTTGQLAVNFTGHAATAGPTVPIDGAWHQIDLDFDMDGNTPATSTFSVQLDGGSLTTVTQVNAGPFGCGDINLGINTNNTFSIDVDDYVMFAANLTDAASTLVLPTQNHIVPVPIVTQGATNQWTGNYTAVEDIPPSTSPDTFQAGTAVGQKVTWQKDLHQWNDITNLVAGIKMYTYVRMQGSGTSSVQVIINNVIVNTITNFPLIPAGYPTGARVRGGFDWNTYDPVTYDGIELGLIQNGTLQANAGGIFAEVLCDVTATPNVKFDTLTPNSGSTAGGTVVTFTGTFSRKTGGISFGGSPFTITNISVTQIVGTTSGHAAGVVDVTAYQTTVFPQGYTYVSGIAGIVFVEPNARFNPGHSAERRLDNTPGQFKFETTAALAAGSPLKVVGQGSTQIVNGVAVRSTRIVEAKRTSLKTSIEGTDRQYYLNRRLVYGTWVNTAADQVLTAILATFAPDFSPGGIQGGMPSISVQFARDANVSEAFSKIMQGIGGHWFMDLNGVMHAYIGVPIGIAAPDTLDNNNRSIQYDPQIQCVTDLSQIRNRVYVRGRGNPAAVTTGTPFFNAWWNVNAPLFDFTLAPKGAETNAGVNVLTLSGWRPSYGGFYTGPSGHGQFSFATNSGIWRNFANTQAIVPGNGFDYVGTFPGYGPASITNIHALIAIENPHDPRITGFTLYRMRQAVDMSTWYLVGTIAIDPTGANQYTFHDDMDEASLLAGGVPVPQPNTTGDTSQTIYVMQEDTVAQGKLAAIEGGDGIHEYQINDPSIQTTADATSRALAELALFANPIVTFDYYTRDQKSLPGAIVHINLPDIGPVGDYQIQQVTVDQVKNFRRGIDFLVERYHVIASSVRFTIDDLFRRVLLTDTPSSASTSGNVASVIPQPAAPTTGTVTHIGEGVTGTVNGINTLFTTLAPYTANKLAVYRNGVRQQRTADYTETTPASGTFTFVTAPTTGDVITVDYV